MPTLDVSGHYAYRVNLETVTLRDQDGTPLQSVASAKRLLPGTQERAPSKGKYLDTTIDFRLPSANVNSTIIPGCYVVDVLNIAYVVLKVTPPSTYNTTWKCYCIALQVFGDAIDWIRPVDATDVYADRRSSGYTLQGHYDCHIQPITAAITDLLAKRGMRNRFIVYILTELDLEFGDLFQDQNNAKYKVVSWTSKKNLDNAFEVEVEILP